MKKGLRLLFALLVLLACPAMADTWSFGWEKSKADGGEGFYNFGSSRVDKDVYSTTLNGLPWNAAAEGTIIYAYTSKMGQYIGSASEPATSAHLWTDGVEGKVTAIKVTARVQKETFAGNLAVSVNNKAYLCQGQATADLGSVDEEYVFTTTDAQEGRIEIVLNQTSESKGPLYIRKVEIEYTVGQSGVAAPTFTPAAGTYDEAQTVSLSTTNETAGYTYYYTTDGSNPKMEDSSRKEWKEPLTISSTTTLKAVAFYEGEYSKVTEAKYVIRKDAELSFYKEAISLISGEEGYADLLNPHKVSPVKYKSSRWEVCSIDEYGALASSYVTEDTEVTITATFDGNDEYKPCTATMKVTVVAKEPLKTPVVSPLGGTFTEPVKVTISTDDANAVTIWYSTTAKDEEDFEDDYEKSTIVEGQETTFTIDHSCTLYVMTRGYNQNSEVVKANFIVNLPLRADFTTDRSSKTLYSQNFDSVEEVKDWVVNKEWTLSNANFSSIQQEDKSSITINYDAGSANESAMLISPNFKIEEGTSVEFYANFAGTYLIWGDWTFNVLDLDSNDSETLLDAFQWAQENAYDGPAWNKFNFDLSKYAGREVVLYFDYEFGGENLAIDGFRLIKKGNGDEPIRIFEGERIEFESLATGEPESLEWTLPGADEETATGETVSATYNKAGTYDVTLTVRKGEDVKTLTRQGHVIVAQRAAVAKIGLPEEGYKSPWVGVFVPTNVPVTFRDLSTGNPTEWNWAFQFADKSSSQEQNPTVTFIQQGVCSVGLTAGNAAGSSQDILQYAIQAGGAQYVWNLEPEDSENLQKIELGWYGNYAGTNFLGIEQFAEKYQAPLANASIDSVEVFFASVTAVHPEAPIQLTVHAVAENGEPGEVLASASLRCDELQYSDETYLPTVFHLDNRVNLKAGQEFFVAVGPFPNAQLDESPYTMDDISIFCVRGVKAPTSWQLVEDQDENYNGLGTYQWFENADDPTSMAICPCINYANDADAINQVATDAVTDSRIYTLDGKVVSRPTQRGIYVLRQADGTTRKVLKK